MDSATVEVTVLNVNDNVPVIGIDEFVKISKDHEIDQPIASLQVVIFFQNRKKVISGQKSRPN